MATTCCPASSAIQVRARFCFGAVLWQECDIVLLSYYAVASVCMLARCIICVQCLCVAGTGRAFDPALMTMTLAIHMALRAGNDINVELVYCTLFRMPPPATEDETDLDPGWLVRNPAYDAVQPKDVYVEARYAVCKARQQRMNEGVVDIDNAMAVAALAVAPGASCKRRRGRTRCNATKRPRPNSVSVNGGIIVSEGEVSASSYSSGRSVEEVSEGESVCVEDQSWQGSGEEATMWLAVAPMRGEVGMLWQTLQWCGGLAWQLWPQVPPPKKNLLGGAGGAPCVAALGSKKI